MIVNPTSVPFDRQKRLLGLLHALGGDVGNLDFQKLLFLYCRAENFPPYEFVPYKFGAFSFSSYADRRRLVDRGFLEDDEKAWRLTAAGHEATRANRAHTENVANFAESHRTLRGDALVAETYRRHPYYATRSEIAARVLRQDRIALDAIEKARPAKGVPHLATIGYEGRSLEAYLNELLLHGITILCDVRRNAISRKYGFSKRTLANACEGVGVRYEHLPELGIASEQRQGLSNAASYQTLFAEYVEHALPGQGPALTRIRDWISFGDRVALTCYELHAHQCHRQCVADALARQFGPMLEATHL